MAETQGPDVKFPDPVELSRAMARIAEHSQHLVTEFLARQATNGHANACPPIRCISAMPSWR